MFLTFRTSLLCLKFDDQMSESDKVSQTLKGIADDAFNLLEYKDCTTVDTIIQKCRRFEQAKARLIAPQFTRLPNTAASSPCEYTSAPLARLLLRPKT